MNTSIRQQNNLRRCTFVAIMLTTRTLPKDDYTVGTAVVLAISNERFRRSNSVDARFLWRSVLGTLFVRVGTHRIIKFNVVTSIIIAFDAQWRCTTRRYAIAEVLMTNQVWWRILYIRTYVRLFVLLFACVFDGGLHRSLPDTWHDCRYLHNIYHLVVIHRAACARLTEYTLPIM